MADQEHGGMRRWSRSAVATVAIVAAAGTAAAAALLVNVMERKGEAQNEFFRVVELTDDTIDPAVWGKNFPLQYDALPPHGRSAAHAIRWQRSHAAIADRSRPTIHRGAVPARGRSPPEDDVGGLRVCRGFP